MGRALNLDSVTETAIRAAARSASEAQSFLTRFPPLTGANVPSFSWANLQRQLADLSTHTPREIEALLRPLRSTTKPPEMLLRELLIVVAILLMDPPQGM